MFEVLAKIIELIINVSGKYVDLKAHPSAPLRLYELYICLRDVIQSGKGVISDARRIPSGKISINALQHSIERQAERINRLSDLLLNVAYGLGIFNPEGLRIIQEAIGYKFYALFKYYYLICYLDGEKLVINRPDQLSHLSDKHMRMFDIEPDELRKQAFIHSSTIDLNNREQVTALCDEAQRHIEMMERALEKLGEFIRQNCEFSDLFPKGVSRGWPR